MCGIISSILHDWTGALVCSRQRIKISTYNMYRVSRLSRQLRFASKKFAQRRVESSMPKQTENEKSAHRDANTARAGCSKVRTPPTRPPVANTQTHRQDRLQYTSPQLASAQCNKQRLRRSRAITTLTEIAGNWYKWFFDLAFSNYTGPDLFCSTFSFSVIISFFLFSVTR